MQGLQVSCAVEQVLYNVHTWVQVHLLGSKTNQPLFSSTNETKHFGFMWKKPMGH